MGQFTFDFDAAVHLAFENLWAEKLKAREEGRDFQGDTYYTTATELERKVRGYAQDVADGEQMGARDHYGMTVVRLNFDLKERVRTWLLRHPHLESHNFSKGHISGERFRPVDAPLSPQEQHTMAKKVAAQTNPRPQVKHYGDSMPECQRERMKGRFRTRRSKAWYVSDKSKVTCKQCLKLIAEGLDLTERTGERENAET